MKKFTIAYEWSVCGEITVEANTLEEAIEKVEDINEEDLPNDYIDDSWKINHDVTNELNQNMESET